MHKNSHNLAGKTSYEPLEHKRQGNFCYKIFEWIVDLQLNTQYDPPNINQPRLHFFEQHGEEGSGMSEASDNKFKLLKTEDYWAIWLGLLVIGLSMAFFWAGSTLKPWAVTPGKWSTVAELGQDLSKNALGYILVFLGFGTVFTISMKIMGRNIKQFIPGFIMLFAGALIVFYLAGWSVMKQLDLGAPLLALVIGLIIGNIRAMPSWFGTALRTEYYIKTGIVLLGATLPLTLIAEAGPIAFVQATIVSVTTWTTIYFAATRIFKLDNRFAAVLGTGGAVCGVSGSIAIGGAIKADKDHIAIGIGVVSVWAIVMIFSLAFLTKAMIPSDGNYSQWWNISAGEAGAWVGTSEYADAAGFAVVAELATEHGDAPIQTFTLMKVIGRDIWIGIWAFVLSIISVIFWERKKDSKGSPGAQRDGPTGRLGVRVVWDRFPKFVLGFVAASVIMSFIAASAPADYKGTAPVEGSFKSKALKKSYKADFSNYQVPDELQEKFSYDGNRKVISFLGKMSAAEYNALAAKADSQQVWALRNLRHKSDWFTSELKAKSIVPIKKLRSWAFVLCFLCIGLSTRFKDLVKFGLKPFWAFTIGVLVNVPLGWFLTTQVFVNYWRAI